MSATVSRVLPLLKVLSKVKDKKVRRSILSAADTGIFSAIAECCHNILFNRRLRITPAHKKKLYRHRKVLRQLAKRGSSLVARKRAIGKQTGGFLPLILGPLLGLISGIAGRAIGRAAGL